MKKEPPMTRALPAVLTVFLFLAPASPLPAADSRVSGAAVSATRIEPGGTFKVTATVHDEDGLMGCFLLHISNAQMPYAKDIEYRFPELSGKKEATIELIVGPGDNSRHGNADISEEWFVGSVTRVRLTVRDVNDDRTSFPVGEVKVVPGAPRAEKAEKSVGPHLASGDGWRVDFDDGTLGGAVEPHYIVRRTGKAARERLHASIKDGVLRLGGDFDEEGVRTGDYVIVRWPDIGAPSITDFPVLEIRCAFPKNSNFLVFPIYQYEDGSSKQPYLCVGGKEEDGWKMETIRLAGDSSLPRKWTPRRLLGVNVWLRANKPGPAEAKIDWIRLRPFNAEESTREKYWVALMKDYVAPEPAVLREFFPFGSYSDSVTTSSKCKTGQRLPLWKLARGGLNTLEVGPIVAPAGYQGGIVPPSGKGIHPVVADLEATGMRMMIRASTDKKNIPTGPEEAASWTRYITEQVGRSPAILGYNMKDEPDLSWLWGLVAGKRILETADPERPVLINFNNLVKARSFAPYLTLTCTDKYPLQPGSPGRPEDLFSWCRQIAKDTDNKRQWVIVQSFGDAPWRRRRGYIVPTPEQVRLQTYAALAGGARGIFYYSYSYDRYLMMMDQWGNPSERFEEVRKLAAKLIPLCHRLLDCLVDFDAQLTLNNKRVIAGALFDPVRNVHYVVTVNTDTESPQQTTLSLPQAWTAAGKNVYDLIGLREGGPASRNTGLAALEPGGGCIYLVGTTTDFETDRRAILTKQVEEMLRVRLGDLSVAKANGADIREVDRLRAAALASIRSGDLKAARRQARQAGEALDAVLAELSPYAEIVGNLDEIARLMGSVEPAMFEDNPNTGDMMADLRWPYWAVHKIWAHAYERVLKGDTWKLSGEVEDLLGESRRIAAKIREALGDGPLY